MPFSNLIAPYAALRVCVNKSEGGRLTGLVYSQRLTAPLAFDDVGFLLLRLDEVMDRQNFPQAYQQARTFGARQSAVPAADEPEHGLSAEAVAAARGGVGTFLLYITARRNSTWQGTVDWLDGTRQEFTSALELLALIQARF